MCWVLMCSDLPDWGKPLIDRPVSSTSKLVSLCHLLVFLISERWVYFYF